MRLEELQGQESIPITLFEKGGVRSETNLGDLENEVSYKIAVSFMDSEEIIHLGDLTRNQIYERLSESYLVGSEEFHDSNVKLYGIRINHVEGIK